MHNRFIKSLVVALCVCALLLSACQSALQRSQLAQSQISTSVAQTLTAAPTNTPIPTATFTPSPTPSPTPEIIDIGPANFPADVNPLTGLKVDDPALLNRRPVMIKVANQEGARPHAGLSNADIVFDYYIGQGLDRFLALYYGKDDAKIGTIRSGRYVDIPLVNMYGGILGMMSAYEPELYKIMQSLGTRLINNEQCSEFKALCNDGPKTVVSAFANSAEMSRLYASKDSQGNIRPNLDGMGFGTIPPEGGSAADVFTVHYGRNVDHQWVYDPATRKYVQWINQPNAQNVYEMIPLIDRNNNQPITFSNVVVIFATLDVLNGNTDSIHKYYFPETNGRALICRDGKVYEVTYNANGNGPFSFYDANGAVFKLQPGNTWFHLVGLRSDVEQNPQSTWLVTLSMP